MGPVEEVVLIVVCVTLPVGLCGAALSWKLGRLERKRQMFLTGTLADFEDLNRGSEQRQRPSAGTHGAVVAMLAQEARAEHAGTDSRGACGVEAERANAAAANAPAVAVERASTKVVRASSMAANRQQQLNTLLALEEAEDASACSSPSSPSSPPERASQGGSGIQAAESPSTGPQLLPHAASAPTLPDRRRHSVAVSTQLQQPRAAPVLRRAETAGESLQRVAPVGRNGPSRRATAPAGGPSAAEAYPQSPVAACANPQHVPSTCRRNSLDSRLANATAPPAAAAPAAAAPAALPPPPHSLSGCSQSWLDLPVDDLGTGASSPESAASGELGPGPNLSFQWMAGLGGGSAACSRMSLAISALADRDRSSSRSSSASSSGSSGARGGHGACTGAGDTGGAMGRVHNLRV